MDGTSERLLSWEGCYNARDLGGYVTEDGRVTQWGRVLRSDNLARLSDAGRAALEEHGVATIVDLRLPHELEEHPPPFRGHPAIRYLHRSFIDPAAAVGPNDLDELEPVETLVEDYDRMLAKFGTQVAAIMSAIAGAPEGPVLIYCHSGKDRTGLISALLLRLAGVSIATVSEDYGLTSQCLWPIDREWLESGPGERAEREAGYAWWHARPEVMREVLEHLEARHGSVEGYLLAAGVTSEEIRQLRERLLV